MNKRIFTITLLIWLFSQQVIAAAVVMSDVAVSCKKHHASLCSKNVDQSFEHAVSELNDDSEGATLAPFHHSMAVCDLCMTSCLFSLVSHVPISFATANCSDLITGLIPSPLNTFLNNTLRPPIIS